MHAERDPGLPIMKSFPYKYTYHRLFLILDILQRLNVDDKTLGQLQNQFYLAREE